VLGARTQSRREGPTGRKKEDGTKVVTIITIRVDEVAVKHSIHSLCCKGNIMLDETVALRVIKTGNRIIGQDLRKSQGGTVRFRVGDANSTIAQIR